MSLLSQIRSDQIQARRNRDAARTSILTTLLSEAANVGLDDGKRESTDAEVIAVSKKFIKNIDETIAVISSPNQVLLAEREILVGYLPSQLSENELEVIIIAFLEGISSSGERSMKLMGPVMKQLREDFEGRYDGKLASDTVKRILTS